MIFVSFHLKNNFLPYEMKCCQRCSFVEITHDRQRRTGGGGGGRGREAAAALSTILLSRGMYNRIYLAV